MKQVTLVALYGEKKKEVADLVALCQKVIAEALRTCSKPGAFKPYELAQVHATIVGLERYAGSRHDNLNYEAKRQRKVPMNVDGYFNYLRQCGHIPFEVQIGGFAERDYPFTSRDTTPFKRSFSVQEGKDREKDSERVVVMGWPVRGKPLDTEPGSSATWAQEARLYPTTLDAIRHAAQGFGILHGYHKAPTDVDNDLFFRIGLIEPKALTPPARSYLEYKIRRLLGAQPPLIIDIGPDDIFVASYVDDTLPPDSTKTWPLTDPRVTGPFVESLYE